MRLTKTLYNIVELHPDDFWITKTFYILNSSIWSELIGEDCCNGFLYYGAAEDRKQELEGNCKRRKIYK